MRARAAAGGQQRRDIFDVDTERALEALRLGWGDAYAIDYEDGLWTAVRRDAPELVITGVTPDELEAGMRADWAHEGTL